MDLVVLLGYGAATIGVVVALPQWVRIRRSRSIEGVSWATWVLAAAAGLLWTAYSVALGSWPLILGNGLALAGSAAVTVALARRGCVPVAGWLGLAAATCPPYNNSGMKGEAPTE
jgi:uncharacterized protein with PQ loop repeat